MLVQLTDRVYVLPGGVNIGVVRLTDSTVALIDAGLNDTPARKAIRATRDELGSDIVAIVTTHGHADHFGGNNFIVKRTGARVYAPRVEEVMLRYPMLQPTLLYGGADPLDSIRTEFLLAPQSPVDVIYDAGTISVEGALFEAIGLAGHSINQMGISIDGVLFSADVVAPAAVLEKYSIPYVFSVTDHLNALERAGLLPANVVVPGHGPILESIVPIRDLNLTIVHQTMDLIVETCVAPMTASAITRAVLDGRGASPTDAVGFYLLQPTIAAYLTHLTRAETLHHSIARNESTWSTI